MSNIEDLKTLIAGLEARRVDLDGQKDLFVKAQGIDVEAEKLRAEVGDLTAEIEKKKEELKALVEQKNSALAPVLSGIVARMNEVLPAGTAAIEITEDGSLSIGWKIGGKVVPYAGLSGGEKASFDPALCRALGASVLLVEAAELDGARLSAALDKYAATGLQVIVSSCHEPLSIPEGCEVVRL